ncbi:hypothetical protein E1301_Tti002787 [Triplophysa tibetana]|uniref:Uncharacterized protein n=1 Tax=Triplophysa tibetana TaxID=1572043 RepID=A0A5A9NPW1_9TELE|nr:hypothetical protein E1301_Tti002787 [Triplophysa tibetana]
MALALTPDYQNLSETFSVLTMSVGLAEGRRMRRRRGVCEYGTYQHEGKTCCLCPSGYRVISDCKDNIATQCEICQPGFFATHPNNDQTCRRCRDCDPERTKMEKQDSCSRDSDTVCRCQENYFCDKGHLCRTCQPCDTCVEKGGVKIPCTFTNNTVCHGVEESKGVDLNPYLQEISSILTQKYMIGVARCTGMTEADIEQHELNHPKDAKEQTYRLLVDWSQSQGLNEAYPTLIQKLLELKAKRIADQIIEIVQREPVKTMYSVK